MGLDGGDEVGEMSKCARAVTRAERIEKDANKLRGTRQIVRWSIRMCQSVTIWSSFSGSWVRVLTALQTPLNRQHSSQSSLLKIWSASSSGKVSQPVLAFRMTAKPSRRLRNRFFLSHCAKKSSSDLGGERAIFGRLRARNP
jgi:hypothetical protein